MRDQLRNRWAELSYLSRCGFAVPKTLVTSDPDEFEEFYEKLQGHVVCKPVAAPDREFRPVSRAELDQVDRIRLCPVHLEESGGPSERLVVVGSKTRVLARGAQPPDELQQMGLEAARDLDLNFAEVFFRQKEGQWQATGLRAFLSPEVLSLAEVLELACELLEQGLGAQQ